MDNNTNQTETLKSVEIGKEGSYTYKVPPETGMYGNKAKKKGGIPDWGMALIIIAAVILCIALLATSCNKAIDKVADSIGSSDESSTTVTTNYGHDYIGVINIEGTISEDGSNTYNHEYILNSIDAMENDSENKGIILYLDTPGGEGKIVWFDVVPGICYSLTVDNGASEDSLRSMAESLYTPMQTES